VKCARVGLVLSRAAPAAHPLMSTWPVSDYINRQIMTSYYTGLSLGLGRGEVLRQTQLALMRRDGREHPFYWASFIQAGDWRSIQPSANGK
jgi:CHAT domain-containing protein